MRYTLGSTGRTQRTAAGLTALRTVCSALLLAGLVSAAHAAASQVRHADSQPAQTPLRDIAGAEPPSSSSQPSSEPPEVRAACDEARAKIEDGRFREAAEKLAAVSKQPGGDRYEVHYLLAQAQARMGQLAAARESAEAAARLAWGAADVHYLLGQINQAQGDSESALAQYRTATLAADRELDNVRITLAWVQLGQLLEQKGYWRAAAEAYEHFDTAVWQTHVEQRNAGEVAALLAEHPYGMVSERLRLLQSAGRMADAVRTVESAREIWPHDAVVARWYAETLLAADQAERALQFCRSWTDDSGGGAGLGPVTVDAARAAGRLPELIEDVAGRVAEGRDCGYASGLVRYLRVVGESASAVRLGQSLLAQRPADSVTAWVVARTQESGGDVRGALETLIAFVRCNPGQAIVPAEWLAEWPGTADSGVGDLVQELRGQENTDFATDFVLGVTALAAGEQELAGGLLRACTDARPDYAPAHLVRAEMLLTAYRWDEAEAEAARVLEERSGLAGAHFVQAQAHEGLDEPAEAEQGYKEAIRLAPDEPLFKLALARHYRQSDNLRGAQRYFQETLSLDLANGAALEGLIESYVASGKTEIARAQLERIDKGAVPADSLRRINTTMRFVGALFGPAHLAELKRQHERHPDDLTTAQLLAAGLSLAGRLDEALEVIHDARAAHAQDYGLMSLLAKVHAAREEYDEAIDLLQTLAGRYPNRLAVLEPLAAYYLDDFRVEEGRKALRRVLEHVQDPQRRAEARDRLLDSYWRFGDYDGALQLIDTRIDREPQEDGLLLQKAVVLLQAERLADAQAALEAYIDRAPADRDHRARYARIAPVTQQYDAVLKRIRGWVEADPSDSEETEWLIEALIAADRPDEALEVARKFEGTYAGELQRRIWLGRCQAAAGNTDKALAEFDALLSERLLQNTHRLEVWRRIIETLLRADRADEALLRCEEWLKAAEDLHPVFRPVALHWQRRVLQYVGRDRESAEVMEALLPYGPELGGVVDEPNYTAGLLNDLGYVWADMGVNLEQASALIRRALAEEPWNAAFLDSLGWAYYKAGDFEKARKYLDRAVRLRDGQDPIVYDHLADAAFRLGEQENARRYWDTALSLANDTTAPSARAELTELVVAVRAKLAALGSSRPPDVAPTAAEQSSEPEKD